MKALCLWVCVCVCVSFVCSMTHVYMKSELQNNEWGDTKQDGQHHEFTDKIADRMWHTNRAAAAAAATTTSIKSICSLYKVTRSEELHYLLMLTGKDGRSPHAVWFVSSLACRPAPLRHSAGSCGGTDPWPNAVTEHVSPSSPIPHFLPVASDSINKSCQTLSREQKTENLLSVLLFLLLNFGPRCCCSETWGIWIHLVCLMFYFAASPPK